MNPPLAGKFSSAFSSPERGLTIWSRRSAPIPEGDLVNWSRRSAPIDDNKSIGAFDFESLILKLPKEQQDKARVKLIESQIEAEATKQAIAPLIPEQQSLEELGKFRENEARLAQQLGKESLWQTGAAYALFKGIPQTITNAFARTAEANREAGYAIPRAYADTFRALSRGPY